MPFDFEQALKEAKETIDKEGIARNLSQNYVSVPKGSNEEDASAALHYATFNTAIQIASEISKELLKKYHQELQNYLK